MKIISVVGARPQFIKAAVVSEEIARHGQNGKNGNIFEEILVHTGQHYDVNMSDVFFKELAINEPGYFLGIGSAAHGHQTGRMLAEIETVLLREKPDLVMVYGDTNSTLAGALAASKLHIPTAHVEAGLRSYDKKMPEEINRVLTDHVSTLLFSPTPTGLQNLEKEGFTNVEYAFDQWCDQWRDQWRDGSPPRWSAGSPLCINVGDVMLDLALKAGQRADVPGVLARRHLEQKHFVLVTLHRAENTDNKANLEQILDGLCDLAQKGERVFFPVHPRTRRAMGRFGLPRRPLPDTLTLAEPVSYLEMIALERSARLIITDSGGVQKEGYFFGTPCLVTRETTEWVEVKDAGWTRLTGAHRERITAGAEHFRHHPPPPKTGDIFGGGHAAANIVEVLNKWASSC